MENTQQEAKEINPTELKEKISKVAYSFLRKINDIKKQQKELEKKLEITEEQLDKFLDWVSNQLGIGWEQGWNMSLVSKEYCKILRQQKNICYIGLLDYWNDN